MQLRQNTLTNYKEMQAIEAEFKRLELPAPVINETDEESADMNSEYSPGTVNTPLPAAQDVSANNQDSETLIQSDELPPDPFFSPAAPQKKQPAAATITQSPATFTQSDEDEPEMSNHSEESEQPEPVAAVKQIKPAASTKKQAPTFSWN